MNVTIVDSNNGLRPNLKQSWLIVLLSVPLATTLRDNWINTQLKGNAFPILTHWGRVTHICVGKLTIIGSDNGLSPGRRQAIIWTNAGTLLIWPLGTNFSEILIAIESFSLKKMHLKISSAKWRPFCLGLNVLNFRRLCSALNVWRGVQFRTENVANLFTMKCKNDRKRWPN